MGFNSGFKGLKDRAMFIFVVRGSGARGLVVRRV